MSRRSATLRAGRHSRGPRRRFWMLFAAGRSTSCSTRCSSTPKNSVSPMRASPAADAPRSARSTIFTWRTADRSGKTTAPTAWPASAAVRRGPSNTAGTARACPATSAAKRFDPAPPPEAVWTDTFKANRTTGQAPSRRLPCAVSSIVKAAYSKSDRACPVRQAPTAGRRGTPCAHKSPGPVGSAR